MLQVAEWKVLLIEAGVNEPAGSQVPSFYGDYVNSTIDWQYLTEPQDMACLGNEGRRCSWPRGKVSNPNRILYLTDSTMFSKFSILLGKSEFRTSNLSKTLKKYKTKGLTPLPLTKTEALEPFRPPADYSMRL